MRAFQSPSGVLSTSPGTIVRLLNQISDQLHPPNEVWSLLFMSQLIDINPWSISTLDKAFKCFGAETGFGVTRYVFSVVKKRGGRECFFQSLYQVSAELASQIC